VAVVGGAFVVAVDVGAVALDVAVDVGVFGGGNGGGEAEQGGDGDDGFHGGPSLGLGWWCFSLDNDRLS